MLLRCIECDSIVWLSSGSRIVCKILKEKREYRTIKVCQFTLFLCSQLFESVNKINWTYLISIRFKKSYKLFLFEILECTTIPDSFNNAFVNFNKIPAPCQNKLVNYYLITELH